MKKFGKSMKTEVKRQKFGADKATGLSSDFKRQVGLFVPECTVYCLIRKPRVYEGTKIADSPLR